MKRLQHGFDTLGETDDIAVVAFEDNLIAFVFHADDVDSADGTCLRTYVV